jgi:hypothetical protein
MTPPLPTRAELAVLLDELAARQLTAQARARHWRNVTIGLCIALVVILPVFAIVAPKIGSGLVRIRGSAGTGNAGMDLLSVGDLLAVELWGVLGGIIGVIAAVSRIKDLECQQLAAGRPADSQASRRRGIRTFRGSRNPGWALQPVPASRGLLDRRVCHALRLRTRGPDPIGRSPRQHAPGHRSTDKR